MAEPFTVFTSRVVPIPAENVDTDQIVPARYLKVTDKNGLLPIVVDPERHRQLFELVARDPDVELSVDLASQLVVMTARIPQATRAHGACSRDEPQPKLSPARRICRPYIWGLSRTNVGSLSPPSAS